MLLSGRPATDSWVPNVKLPFFLLKKRLRETETASKQEETTRNVQATEILRISIWSIVWRGHVALATGGNARDQKNAKQICFIPVGALRNVPQLR